MAGRGAPDATKTTDAALSAGLRSSYTDNGLTKFGYRWQSSVTGGWIERETLDTPLDPNNANRYAYAAVDPVNRYDLNGQAADVLVATAGLAVSSAGGPVGFALGIASYTFFINDMYAAGEIDDEGYFVC